MPVSITYLCGDPGSNYFRDWLSHNACLKQITSESSLNGVKSDVLVVDYRHWSDQIPCNQFSRVLVFDLCDEYWRRANPEGDNVFYGKICCLKSDMCRTVLLPYVTLTHFQDYIKKYVVRATSPREGVCFHGSATQLLINEHVDWLGVNPLCPEVHRYHAESKEFGEPNAYTHRYFQRLDWLKRFYSAKLKVNGGLVDRGIAYYLNKENVCKSNPEAYQFFVNALSNEDVVRTMCESEVALCPAGHGIWSSRMYEAQAARCVLVCPNLENVCFLHKPVSYVKVDMHADPVYSLMTLRDRCDPEANSKIEGITSEYLFNQVIIKQLRL